MIEPEKKAYKKFRIKNIKMVLIIQRKAYNHFQIIIGEKFCITEKVS